MNSKIESHIEIVVITLALALAATCWFRNVDAAYGVKLAMVIIVTLLASRTLEYGLLWLKRCWQVITLILLVGLFATAFGWIK